ncbi:MAG TPA: dienelactone hydrolase family protein [Ferrovibrio sp.]|jgi:carboxymethylenebutenolidase|uniref:dienelactone hydrolase family protein n=1 Tax=Ferrovibrio sp. TaxID=1917215 RepID=UPI002ED0E37A
MGTMTNLTAADGHRFEAYIAEPKTAAKGGLVVIQEIFGVNNHMKSVCDGFAADGYYCVAPALFDRIQRGVDLGYSPEDIAKGRELRGKMNWTDCMRDVTTAVAAAGAAGRVGITGYCYGGGVTWLAAAIVPGLSASVGYYGGPWAELIDNAPQCPALLHFGAKDAMIPVTLAQTMKAKHPTITTHIYDADHGFNCDQRPVYDGYAAALARRRTLAFFDAIL